MTEQEALQENAKLQARLQKAITVFGEQKANIARLTEERDSANAEVDKLKARVAELEQQTTQKDEQDASFFEQVQEIEDLKEKLATTEQEVTQKEEEYDVLRNKANEEIASLNTKLEDANTAIENLRTSVKDFIGHLSASVKELKETL